MTFANGMELRTLHARTNSLLDESAYIAMAPDRGSPRRDPRHYAPVSSSAEPPHPPPNNAAKVLAERADEPQNFTIRGVLVGLVIGVIICFSNMYFGLQTGWVSGMAMPSALLGFAYFKTVSRLLSYPFSPVENVLVQSVAGSVGTMPLGCGFVGVIPALNFMLTPEENGPLRVGLWKLTVWAVGIAFFGVVFAVPLRRQVIIREKLKFPSGTATALMIGVLHGQKGDAKIVAQDAAKNQENDSVEADQSEGLQQEHPNPGIVTGEEYGRSIDEHSDWRAKIRLLAISFGISALYVSTYSPIISIAAHNPLDAGVLLHSPTTRHSHVRSLPC